MRAWRDVAKEVVAEVQRDDIPSLAAGVAFRIFLSLFPSLIAAVAILNIVVTRDEVGALIDNLSGVAPQAVVDLLEPLVSPSGDNAGGALVFGVVAGVWAASSAAVALMKALSRARDGVDTRSFLVLRGLGLVITVALFAAIIALLGLLVFGSQIQAALLPRIAGGALGALSPLVTFGRYVAAILVLQVLFAFIYWIGPDRSYGRPPWQWWSRGAVLGVVGWLLASYGFSLYTRFADYGDNPAYAGFGGIIVVLLWLQITMMLLLVGAELNFVFERRRRAAAEVEVGAGFGMVDPLAAMGDADLLPPEPVGPRSELAAGPSAGAPRADGSPPGHGLPEAATATPGVAVRGGRRSAAAVRAGLIGGLVALLAAVWPRRGR